MKIKVLFVIGILGVNGATKSLVQLLSHLSRDKYDISLFLFWKEAEYLKYIPKWINVLPEIVEYRLRCLPFRQFLAEALRFRKYQILFYRIKGIICRMLKLPCKTQWNIFPDINGNWDCVCSFPDGFVSTMVINKIPNGKKVLWVHENYEENPKPKEVLESFKQADAIAGVSKDALTHLRNLLGESIKCRTFVVHNIVDSQKVQSLSRQEKVTLPGKVHNIISVGRISPEKGYDLIPSILEQLQQSGVAAHWTIIGGGVKRYEDSIMAEARRRGVFDRIHFLGEKQNPHPWTAAADCFVQLSRHEGWCMTITEALALGKPVVATDMPVFREQIVDGVNGFLAKDFDSFAVAIQQVLRGELQPSGHSFDSPCSPKNVKEEFNRLMCEICE